MSNINSDNVSSLKNKYSNTKKRRLPRGTAIEVNSDTMISKKARLDVKHDEEKNDANDASSTIITSTTTSNITDEFLSLERDLCTKLQSIVFPSPVVYVYHPIEYAYEVHAMYVRKYCNSIKKILFLGMNPGPWGMSQTGVPFGEITMVRDWLKISGPVNKPAKEQPERKVTGFECTRSEVSGKRLWGLFQKLCGEPEKFFEHAYIHNYCPLALMDSKGRNITPAELKGESQNILHATCDKALVDVIHLLKVEIIIAIGKYAEKRAETVVKEVKLPIKILYLYHPSPRAVGNENWDKKAEQQLRNYKLLQYFSK